MKVAWLLINASHYHVARWRTFAQCEGVDAVMVEIANRDAGFEALSTNNASEFERVTLFPGKTWRDVSGQARHAAIRGTLDRLLPNVVCINGWSIGGSIASLQWALENDRRVVLFSDSNRFDLSRRKSMEWLKRRLVSLANAGLAGGTASCEYLIDLGMKPEMISVGYDVVDNAHFGPASDHTAGLSRPSSVPEGPYFIAAARFEPKKNHVRLLQAFAKYREAVGAGAWPLALLGDGMLRSEIEAERDRLNLGASLILPGFAGYSDLPQWYRHAACFIHPSTTEQWGLVVNEAMAAGLPVLVSNRCGCAPDLVQDGYNGYTFDPYNPDQLTDLMLKMASDTYNLTAMGQASQTIIAHWSPQTFAENLQKAVELALTTPRPPANPFDLALLWALCRR